MSGAVVRLRCRLVPLGVLVLMLALGRMCERLLAIWGRVVSLCLSRGRVRPRRIGYQAQARSWRGDGTTVGGRRSIVARDGRRKRSVVVVVLLLSWRQWRQALERVRRLRVVAVISRVGLRWLKWWWVPIRRRKVRHWGVVVVRNVARSGNPIPELGTKKQSAR